MLDMILSIKVQNHCFNQNDCNLNCCNRKTKHKFMNSNYNKKRIKLSWKYSKWLVLEPLSLPATWNLSKYFSILLQISYEMFSAGKTLCFAIVCNRRLNKLFLFNYKNIFFHITILYLQK